MEICGKGVWSHQENMLPTSNHPKKSNLTNICPAVYSNNKDTMSIWIKTSVFLVFFFNIKNVFQGTKSWAFLSFIKCDSSGIVSSKEVEYKQGE